LPTIEMEALVASHLNVGKQLSTMARDRPSQAAIRDPRHARALTFQQLEADSDLLASGFEQIGITPGTRAVLMVPPSLEFFSVTFALFKLGAVVVLIDPGMGIKSLGRRLGEAEPVAFIGTTKAHLARRLLGWAKGSVRLTIGVKSKFLCNLSLSQIRDLAATEARPTASVPSPDDVAAIVFTSGSTGPAKGAVYTHGNFATQIAALKELFDIQSGEVDLSTFPLFGLYAPAMGMTAVIPDMDPTRPARASPRKILGAVRESRVTNLFGSPALIDRLGRYQGGEFDSLLRIVSAGAPVAAKVIARLTTKLPRRTQVHTPYGATEALPIACIGSDEILSETRAMTDLGAGVCVGRPAPSTEIAIIPISDNPIKAWDESLRLPVGQIGEITAYGPQVTQEYFNRPDLTALAKIPDAVRGRAWHRMGDVGYLDEKGRLWMCGRKSQRVTTPNGPMFTISCEGIFNTHPAVFRSALVGVGRWGNHEPILCVELEPQYRNIDRIALTRELLAIGGKFDQTRPIRRILFHRGFPVDIRHNAKIGREKLAVWAARRLR